MPQRETCILENTELLETLQKLHLSLDNDYITHSLQSCLNCLQADRTDAVNLHGHLQGLYTLLGHILTSVEQIKNNKTPSNRSEL